MSKGGAPLSKFTPERVDAIIADIGDFVPYKIAAESNGIAEVTFYDWIKNGVRDFLDGKESEYTRLVKSLRNIEKNRIKQLSRNIHESEKGHKGAEWILEHSFWRYFSANAAVVEFNRRLDAMEQNNAGKKEMDSKCD